MQSLELFKFLAVSQLLLLILLLISFRCIVDLAHKNDLLIYEALLLTLILISIRVILLLSNEDDDASTVAGNIYLLGCVVLIFMTVRKNII